MTASELGRMIIAAVEGIERAGSLDAALERVVASFSRSSSIWRAWIWEIRPEGEAELLASWNPSPSAFEPGLIVKLTLTDDVAALGAAVLDGKSSLVNLDVMDLGLLGHVLAREGVREAAIAPVGFGVDRRVRCVVLAGWQQGSIPAEVARALRAVTKAAGDRLNSLADTFG